MGIIKNKILKFFLTLKYLMFFMAFVYFFVWGVQFYSIALFKKLNNIFGFLPDFFNGLISISININDKIIPLSYVFSALLMALFALLFLIIAKMIENIKIAEIKRKMPLEPYETDSAQTKENFIKPHKTTKKREEKINFFCALLEFKLRYIEGNLKTDDDIEKLKKEYSRIIKRKLNEKYSSHLRFVVTDRVFLICNDFSLLNSIVVDILKLYKVICNIDNQKSIKTDYLLSFYASMERTNIKENLKILYKINEFKNLNRVVVNHDIFLRYWDLKDRIFDFKPMENVKLSNIISSKEDLEVNLYYIKNTI